MGKSTISMAIFNSYVSLPEGTACYKLTIRHRFSCHGLWFSCGSWSKAETGWQTPAEQPTFSCNIAKFPSTYHNCKPTIIIYNHLSYAIYAIYIYYIHILSYIQWIIIYHIHQVDQDQGYQGSMAWRRQWEWHPNAQRAPWRRRRPPKRRWFRYRRRRRFSRRFSGGVVWKDREYDGFYLVGIIYGIDMGFMWDLHMGLIWDWYGIGMGLFMMNHQQWEFTNTKWVWKWIQIPSNLAMRNHELTSGVSIDKAIRPWEKTSGDDYGLASNDASCHEPAMEQVHWQKKTTSCRQWSWEIVISGKFAGHRCLWWRARASSELNHGSRTSIDH